MAQAATANSATTGDPKAKRIMARYAKLAAERDSFYLPSWRSAAEWIMPRKSSILGSEKTPGEAGWVDNLFDMTALKACERLANWMMTNTSPAGAKWFAFTASPRTRRRLGASGGAGPVAQWWQHVTEVTTEALQGSNFYSEKPEALLDRNAFGTCAMGTFLGKRRPLNFRCVEVGTYVIAADAEGYIDTIIRHFKLTARQAAQQFGKESLGKKLTQAFEKEEETEFEFYHAVYPNADRDPDRDDSANKLWASCYVSKADENIVQEAGFDEMPYAVSRFVKWTGETWGWAPAFTALPTVRETNFFKMQMNALAELAAFPPMAEPDTLAGQLDLRAGGRNVVESTDFANQFPRPLYQPDARQMEPGMMLLEQNRDDINAAFFGDIIAMFANLEREITAYEASQLSAEKLDIFSPYYFRLINELDTPTLERVFTLLLEAGYYDDPPAELLEDNGDGTATIQLPEVVYLSKLALAIQAHEVGSFDALLARVAMLAELDPTGGLVREFIRPIDLERASRGMARNLGFPVDWQRTQREVEEIKAAEAEQAEQAAQAEQAPQLAKAAKDVDSMSPEGKNALSQFVAGPPAAA